MSFVDRIAEEQARNRSFIMHDSDPEFRECLAPLCRAHENLNREHFGGRLSQVHLRTDRTAPRSLGHYDPRTGYGGDGEITINTGLLISPNPRWLFAPLPAEGVRRFVEDLVLRFMNQQFVYEVHGTLEPGYEGFGPHFCAQANHIGISLGLPQVIVRRRGPSDADSPLCRGWPHNVRPEGYYGNDITEELLDLATGRNNALHAMPAPPSLGLLEILLRLLNHGRVERAREVLYSHIDRLQSDRLKRRPRNHKAEQGLTDIDGSPLGEVIFDLAWLAWENGTVAKIAWSIQAWRAYSELPILADALEEAGCQDDRILRHLRVNMEHTRLCWVLKGLAVKPE